MALEDARKRAGGPASMLTPSGSAGPVRRTKTAGTRKRPSGATNGRPTPKAGGTPAFQAAARTTRITRTIRI
jgi:hypothetical protein